MTNDVKSYSDIVSLSREEFDERRILLDDVTGTKSDDIDIAKMESTLEVRAGTLAGLSFYVNKQDCPSCGRRITFYDIVKTAADESHHSKSFMLHTLVGTKYVINPPRQIRCSNCSTVLATSCVYSNEQYGCCWDI